MTNTYENNYPILRTVNAFVYHKSLTMTHLHHKIQILNNF